MDKELKIAVLIDAENISHKYAAIILREAASMGNVVYKRIYGNWTTTQLDSWKRAMLENAIQPIQQYSNTVGKNSSDSALIIDAMDLLYQHRLDAFCIVSSDSDFTRLATRLRESEMIVVGMGEQKTPRSFISACNKFTYLDLLYKSSKGNAGKKNAAKNAKKAPEPEKPAERSQNERRRDADVISGRVQVAKTLPEGDEEEAHDETESGFDIQIVEATVRQIAEECSGDDGLILSATLGSLLSKRLPDFDVRNFGFKKFTPFIESLGMFETKVGKSDENGARVIFFRLIEE